MVMGELATSSEVVIIGAGPGGYVAAIRCAQLGLDVTLVDKSEIGGVCLNVGCIPSKAIIHVGDFLDKIRIANELGILVNAPKISLKNFRKWKENVVSTLISGVKLLLKKHGVTYIQGTATFESSHTIRVNSPSKTQVIRFGHAIIATGSSSINVKGFEVDGKKVWSSTEALIIKEIPKRLCVLGGGYIGLELGEVYQKFGSKVTVIERGPQILSLLSSDLSSIVHKKMENLGATILTNTSAVSLKKGRDLSITVDSGGKKKVVKTDVLLVAVGRRPNTANIGLEKTHVKVDEHGFIVVNNERRTSDDKIFAIGDVSGQPMLAHKASREAQVAAEVIAGRKSSFDNLVVPSVIFTDPEVAIVGMDEELALKSGFEPVTGKFPFTASGRALTMNAAEGFVKLIADKKSGLIIGGQIIGPHASELIAEITLAIEMGAVAEDLALTIHVHPTFAEAIQGAAEDVLDQCIHVFKGVGNKPGPEFKSSKKPVVEEKEVDVETVEEDIIEVKRSKRKIVKKRSVKRKKVVNKKKNSKKKKVAKRKVSKKKGSRKKQKAIKNKSAKKKPLKKGKKSKRRR